MPQATESSCIPSGGVWAGEQTLRRWRAAVTSDVYTRPVACRPEQWYLVQASTNGSSAPTLPIQLDFLDASGRHVDRRCVAASSRSQRANDSFRFGWFQTPSNAKHVVLNGLTAGPRPIRVDIRPVAERDSKCHPLSNLCRPGTYRPPFPLERVVLPESLSALAPLLTDQKVEIIAAPKSLRLLAHSVVGSACVIDPEWVRRRQWSLADIERVLPLTWMLLDLPTVAELVTRAGRAAARIATRRAAHEIMSARVEYADVPTRGFSLLDAFPYGTLDDSASRHAGYAARVLVANRSWKRYADETGFALVLGSQTPRADQCNDVISAMRAFGQGEMLATDLPWLVAGALGRPIAPTIAAHALRMHLGGWISDDAQFWNRWDEMPVVIRDIAELVRRYSPLRAVRWKSDSSSRVSLGISLNASGDARPREQLLIRTGRVDNLDAHSGVPPEPMMIVMKLLCRELREQTTWARRALSGKCVTWQFDTAAGLKYAALFDSADPPCDAPPRALSVRADWATTDVRFGHPDPTATADAENATIVVPPDAGVAGDRSITYQTDLMAAIRTWIERR